MVGQTLSKASAAIAAVEKVALMALVTAIFGFVLMNLVMGTIGMSIAWANEVAVYAMILSGFLGASLMLRARIDPAVLLVHEMVPPAAVRALRVAVSLISALFGGVLIYLSWLWFAPASLAAAGFDIAAFEAATFNFTYTDKTPVMGLPMFYLYLVIPFFALAISVHALTNLAEDLGLVARPADLARDLQGGGV